MRSGGSPLHRNVPIGDGGWELSAIKASFTSVAMESTCSFHLRLSFPGQSRTTGAGAVTMAGAAQHELRRPSHLD